MTNLPLGIPPGLVAFIHKLRRDIEKVFDEVKNKLSERKSRASSPVAKSIQANFIALAHNLLRLLEERIRTGENIDNLPERRRKAGRLEKAGQRAGAKEGTNCPGPSNPSSASPSEASSSSDGFATTSIPRVPGPVPWPAWPKSMKLHDPKPVHRSANMKHGDTRNVGVAGLAVFPEKGVDPWKWMPVEVGRREGAHAFAEAP